MKYYIIFRRVSTLRNPPEWDFLNKSFHEWMFTYEEAERRTEKFDSVVLHHKILVEETNKNTSEGKYYLMVQGREAGCAPVFSALNQDLFMTYEQAVNLADAASPSANLVYKILKEVEIE